MKWLKDNTWKIQFNHWKLKIENSAPDIIFSLTIWWIVVVWLVVNIWNVVLSGVTSCVVGTLCQWQSLARTINTIFLPIVFQTEFQTIFFRDNLWVDRVQYFVHLTILQFILCYNWRPNKSFLQSQIEDFPQLNPDSPMNSPPSSNLTLKGN